MLSNLNVIVFIDLFDDSSVKRKLLFFGVILLKSYLNVSASAEWMVVSFLYLLSSLVSAVETSYVQFYPFWAGTQLGILNIIMF